MFRATFLGHHAWLYASERAHILVDPLLFDRFGFTEAVELRVYPPRRIDLTAFPPVDAVFLTHEHEGHFEIASLNLVDRAIPLYISSRSSPAMRAVLEEMGFTVRLLVPGEAVTVGDLEVLPLSGDQVRNGIIDEWDVLAYLVRDLGGDGSLFTHVDIQPDAKMRAAVRDRIERPGLWAYTNNYSDFNFQFSWKRTDPQFMRYFARSISDQHDALKSEWDRPEATLIVGSGWAYGGEQAWLNRNAFPVSSFDAVDILGRLVPGDRFLAPRPGETLVMRGGKLMEVQEKAPFAEALPRSEWPPYECSGGVKWLERYSPATGKRAFPDEDLESLQRELDAFATHLYGRDLFRRLFSTDVKALGGLKPTVALALLADEEGGAYVYEYEPQASRFVPVECADPASAYLGVFECWATDLLAFLRCEISSTALNFGRSRSWSAKPETFSMNVQHGLMEYVHPLRHPERSLAFYRRVFAAQPVPARRVPYAGTPEPAAQAVRARSA